MSPSRTGFITAAPLASGRIDSSQPIAPVVLPRLMIGQISSLGRPMAERTDVGRQALPRRTTVSSGVGSASASEANPVGSARLG